MMTMILFLTVCDHKNQKPNAKSTFFPNVLLESLILLLISNINTCEHGSENPFIILFQFFCYRDIYFSNIILFIE
jgi:hypothetical protein